MKRVLRRVSQMVSIESSQHRTLSPSWFGLDWEKHAEGNRLARLQKRTAQILSFCLESLHTRDKSSSDSSQGDAQMPIEPRRALSVLYMRARFCGDEME